MAMSKRSSHPSTTERTAINFDRIKNYKDGRYKIARDGSLRDRYGKFVNGTRTTGGFDCHPENRRKTGGWDKRMTTSYQYRRYWAMEKSEFVSLGKRYRVLPLEETDNPTDYPYENHTIVEEAAFRAIYMSQFSLAYMLHVTTTVEGYPKRV